MYDMPGEVSYAGIVAAIRITTGHTVDDRLPMEIGRLERHIEREDAQAAAESAAVVKLALARELAGGASFTLPADVDLNSVADGLEGYFLGRSYTTRHRRRIGQGNSLGMVVDHPVAGEYHIIITSDYPESQVSVRPACFPEPDEGPEATTSTVVVN